MRPLPHDEPKKKFLAMFRSHMNAVYGFACRMLNDAHAAEDATQEVFLRLYRALLDGSEIANPRSWLMVTTRNLCLNRLRENRREVSLESVPQQPLRGGGSRIDAAFMLNAALARLDVRQREALLLREFEGFSYAEIAEMTNTTTAGVRSLLYRARIELRAALEKSPKWR